MPGQDRSAALPDRHPSIASLFFDLREDAICHNTFHLVGDRLFAELILSPLFISQRGFIFFDGVTSVRNSFSVLTALREIRGLPFPKGGEVIWGFDESWGLFPL